MDFVRRQSAFSRRLPHGINHQLPHGVRLLVLRQTAHPSRAGLAPGSETASLRLENLVHKTPASHHRAIREVRARQRRQAATLGRNLPRLLTAKTPADCTSTPCVSAVLIPPSTCADETAASLLPGLRLPRPFAVRAKRHRSACWLGGKGPHSRGGKDKLLKIFRIGETFHFGDNPEPPDGKKRSSRISVFELPDL